MQELKCKQCGRHLGVAETIIGELLCANSACRATNQFKIIDSDITKMFTYKFTTPEKPAKKKGNQ